MVGYHTGWWSRELVILGSGEEGRWWGMEVVTKGSGGEENAVKYFVMAIWILYGLCFGEEAGARNLVIFRVKWL